MMRTDNKPRLGNHPAALDATGGCDTRQAILDAARSRFLHYGFKKTTIDEIALDAGVGKGTVYLYFENKEEILLTIARMVKRNVTEQMQAIAQSLATPEEKLRRMAIVKIVAVHDACHSTAHGIELVDEMLRPSLMRCGSEEHEAQMHLIAHVLEEGVRKGDFSLATPDYAQAAQCLAMTMVSFLPPYFNPCHTQIACRHDLEKRANVMLDFVFHGIRRRAE